MLATPALGVWFGAGSVLAPEPRARWLWWLAAAALIVGTAILAAHRRAPNWQVGVLRSVGIAVMSVAVGAGVGALQEAARVREPLAQWAQERATASVTGTIASFPTTRTESTRWALAQADTQTRVDFRLRDLVIHARGQRLRMDADVLVDMPGTWAVPDLGSRVEVHGRLAPPPSSDVAARLRVDGPVDASINALAVLARPGPIDAIVSAMRRGLQASLATLPREPAAVIAGLAVGDTSPMPLELRSQMRSSGLAHLLAVSGGNVAIVLAVAMGLARLTDLGLRGRVLMGIGSLVGFVMLVGPEASVLRAAAMGATTVLAILAGGRHSGLAVLAFATLAVLLLVPEFAISWAFALSVCATGGLLVLAEPIAHWLRSRRPASLLPPIVLLALAVTLSAQLATVPLLVMMGAPVNAGSVPANLLAMPAVPAITVLGLLAAVVAPLWSLGGSAICWLAQWPAAWIVVVARAFARDTGPSLPSGWPGQALVMAIIVAVAMRIGSTRCGDRVRVLGRAVSHGALGCALVAVLLSWAAPAPWPRGDWLVVVCDVGQGDAVLVRARTGEVMLVDTGPGMSDLLECLRDAHIHAIDLLVITHFHRDHVGGTAELLSAVPVRQALVSGVNAPIAEARLTRRLLDESAVPVQTAVAGTTIRLGSLGASVLWPPARAAALGSVDSDSGGDGSIPNNGSIVLLVDDAPLRLLLTGDIETPAQREIMAQSLGRIDVVKVPHHGSRVGAPGFPAWAAARLALISVGAGNPYGHPARQTVDEWQAVGARVCRTDLDGSCAVLVSQEQGGAPHLALARRTSGGPLG